MQGIADSLSAGKKNRIAAIEQEIEQQVWRGSVMHGGLTTPQKAVAPMYDSLAEIIEVNKVG